MQNKFIDKSLENAYTSQTKIILYKSFKVHESSVDYNQKKCKLKPICLLNIGIYLIYIKSENVTNSVEFNSYFFAMFPVKRAVHRFWRNMETTVD